MTTLQKTADRSANERAELGSARAKHMFFDAIYDLWLRRQSEGMTKKDIASNIGCHPSSVTRALAGPGNWGVETFGAFAEALNGYIDVRVVPREDLRTLNYDVYADIIDGVSHKVCAITAYRPDLRQSVSTFGSTSTLTISTPTAVSAFETTASVVPTGR